MKEMELDKIGDREDSLVFDYVRYRYKPFNFVIAMLQSLAFSICFVTKQMMNMVEDCQFMCVSLLMSLPILTNSSFDKLISKPSEAGKSLLLLFLQSEPAKGNVYDSRYYSG